MLLYIKEVKTGTYSSIQWKPRKAVKVRINMLKINKKVLYPIFVSAIYQDKNMSNYFSKKTTNICQ